MSLVIRMATSTDTSALARLNAAFNETSDSPEALAARLADPHRVDIPLLAEVDGQAVRVRLLARTAQPVLRRNVCRTHGVVHRTRCPAARPGPGVGDVCGKPRQGTWREGIKNPDRRR